MSIFAVSIVFVIVWWLVFFAALPFGVRGQFEVGPIPKGTEPAAPADPKLGPKALVTTGVAIVITALVWVVIRFHLVDKLGNF